MTLIDLISSLDRGEQIEITCHEENANMLRLRFFKQVCTMPASTAPLFCETMLHRGQLLQMRYPEVAVEDTIKKSLRNLREYAAQKTGQEGLGTEPKELI